MTSCDSLWFVVKYLMAVFVVAGVLLVAFAYGREYERQHPADDPDAPISPDEIPE